MPRPEYSICRGCGARIPAPAHGPMRTWCSRECARRTRAQKARERADAWQRGHDIAQATVDDLRARSEAQRAIVTHVEAVERLADACMGQNGDLTALLLARAGLDDPTDA